MSPVDDMSARSGGEGSGASSSVSTSSSAVSSPSSLPGLDTRGRSRSITPNSETESGECSEGEMSDLTPCNASPSLSQLLTWGGCRRLERDSVEESWRQHVQTLMTTSSQENLLNTFSLFGRLFRDLRTKTVGLTEDSCSFLVRDGSSFSHQLRGAVSQFESLLGVLGGVPECPHVWCDFTLLCNPHLTERIKFNVLEIQENFDNYVDKKETTLSCLEGLKAHAKLLSLGESLDHSTNLEADQVELCRFLYKLHFQQLLLLESYTKLLQLLSGAASSSGVTDLSSDVAAVRAALLIALSDTLTPPGSPAQLDRSWTGSPQPEEGREGDSPTPKVISPSSGAASPLVRQGDSPTPQASSPASPPASPAPGASKVTSSPPPPAFTAIFTAPAPALRRSPVVVREAEEEEIEAEVVGKAESAVEDVETVEEVETAEDVETVVVSHLLARRWKAVWGVWRSSREGEGVALSQAEQDLADLTQILDIYCRHLADTREGGQGGREGWLVDSSPSGIFVMTVSSVDLGQVCSSLMDISLQLLASVKKLEQSLTQVRCRPLYSIDGILIFLRKF